MQLVTVLAGWKGDRGNSEGLFGSKVRTALA